MARSLQPSEDIKKKNVARRKNLRTLVIHRFAVLEPKAGKAGGRRQKTKGRTETRDKRQKAEGKKQRHTKAHQPRKHIQGISNINKESIYNAGYN